MVSPDDFIDGARIQWGKLASVIVGSLVGAIFTGVLKVILRWADAVMGLLQGFAEFNAALVQLRFGVMADIVAQSWQNALAFVESAGPFAFVVAVAIVLTTFYVFQVLRPRPWGDGG